MAEVVDELPPSGKSPRNYGRYFDGQVWRLLIGVDGPSDPEKFRNAVLSVARFHNVGLSTRIAGDSLYVQAKK